jgi:hypothetical protein
LTNRPDPNRVKIGLPFTDPRTSSIIFKTAIFNPAFRSDRSLQNLDMQLQNQLRRIPVPVARTLVAFKIFSNPDPDRRIWITFLSYCGTIVKLIGVGGSICCRLAVGLSSISVQSVCMFALNFQNVSSDYTQFFFQIQIPVLNTGITFTPFLLNPDHSNT